MSDRHVDTMHVLLARTGDGATRYLLYPHERWTDAKGGPAFGVPAKKISSGVRAVAPSDHAVEKAFRLLASDELGLKVSFGDARRLDMFGLTLVSPTAGVRTSYAVTPVVVPVAGSDAAALRKRLGGEWLPAADALSLAGLSPTVRGVVGRLGRAEGAFDPATRRLIAARGGDFRAFDALFAEITPLLRRRVCHCSDTRSLARFPDQVEEVLQETASKAWRNLSRFDPSKGNAEGWLWTIAYRVAVSKLRQQGVRRTVVFGDNGVPDGRPVASKATPDAALVAEGRDMLDRVDHILAETNEQSRRILWLRYEQGLSNTQIAEELDIPPGTVATRLFRARQLLAERLGRDDNGASRI